MANSGPSTDKIEFDAVETHGTPVSLSDEPSAGRVGTAPGAPVAGEVVVEKKVTKRASDGDDGDSELRQKVRERGSHPAA